MTAAEFGEQLQFELQKCTGIKFPDEIRNRANEAIRNFLNGKWKFPMEQDTTPIIPTISLILKNKDITKGVPTFFDLFMKMIESDQFSGSALDSAVDALSSAPCNYENEQQLRLLQFCSAHVVDKFPNISFLHSCFSTVIALTSLDDPIISTTAIATYQQIFTSLCEKISQGVDNTDDIAEKCGKMSAYQQFPNPLHFILYLLFSDLSCLALKQKPIWITSPQTSAIYDLLEMTLVSAHDFLVENRDLSFVFEGTVIQSLSDDHALNFLLAFIDMFSQQHSNLCCSVINDFMTRISSKSRLNSSPLFFFRRLKYEQIFEIDDNGDTILAPLIAQLVLFTKPNIPAHPIDFKLKPPKFTDRFILTAPYEIALLVVKGIHSTMNEKTPNFINKSLPGLCQLILFMTEYSSSSTIGLSYDALNELCEILEKFPPNDSIDFVKILCDTPLWNMAQTDRPLFEYEQSCNKFSEFLVTVLKKHPNIVRSWQLLIDTILDHGGEIPPDFSTDYSDEQIVNAVTSLMNHDPLPTAIIAKAVGNSGDRFDTYWKAFNNHLEKTITSKPSLQLYCDLLDHGFTQQSQLSLFEFGATIMSKLNEKQKAHVTKKVKKTVANKDINEWESLLHFLRVGPISESFEIFRVICTDHQVKPDGAMDLLLYFAGQKQELNVSLSSFDLLWILHDPEWSFYDGLLPLFGDDRQEVSMTAITTFFNLFTSNFDSTKPEIITKFVENGFDKLLKAVKDDLCKQTALQELSHVCATFYDRLLKEEPFEKVLIPQLLDSTCDHCIKVTNEEIVSNTMDVYQTIAECDELTLLSEAKLRQSLEKVTTSYFNGNALITSTIGKELCLVFKAVGKRHDLHEWIPLISEVINGYKQEQAMVHLTTQRMFDGIREVLHADDLETIKALCSVEDGVTQSEIINVLTDVADREKVDADFIQICEPLFGKEGSQHLEEKIVVACKSEGEVDKKLISLTKIGPLGNEVLVDRFCEASAETKRAVFLNLKANTEAIEKLWMTHMNDNAVWKECAKEAVEAVRWCLKNDHAQAMLNTMVSAVGEDGVEGWLSVVLMKEVVDLLKKNPAFVKKVLQKASAVSSRMLPNIQIYQI